MCSVENWIEKREQILSNYFGHPISPKHFTDDRLARILDFFSNSERWNEFESQLNATIIQNQVRNKRQNSFNSQEKLRIGNDFI